MSATARGTDGSLLSSLPWTLGALSVALAAHVQYLPFWITAAFMACAAWRYVIEKQRRMLPSRWLRAGLALACFLGVLGTYSSISGVGPGSALLAVMAALKLLETRKRRDQFVLLFISIFLLMSALLREQYLWSLPYLLVSILVIMTAWLRMAASSGETPRQSFSTSGRLLLYAVPLAIAMWIFFPRLASPFWAVPVDTSQGSSGLSETMSPGDISSLSLSEEVAFRVRFDDRVPEPRDRYWRGLVLTNFDGRAWSGSEPRIGRPPQEQIAVSGAPISYEITLEPTRQRWIFALDMPMEWSLDEVFMGTLQQLARPKPIDQRIAYKVVSYSDYKVQAELSRAARDWYSTIPASGNPRSTQLAEAMHAAAGSDTQYINAVMQKFNEEAFFYTLQPPPLGNNPIDRFLFDTRRGFCEHYASAFTYMMRSAGIPARVVLGYQGGEINPLGGHLIVRQSDAHAWSEVWLPEHGWYRVDPTSAVAPGRIEYGTRDPSFAAVAATWGFSAQSEFLHRLTLTWDALDAKWNEWILGYGPENQNKFMQWLGMDNPNWRKMMLTLIAIVVAIVLLISGLLMLRYRAPKKDRASQMYNRFVEKTGLTQRTGETPILFAARLSDVGAYNNDTVNAVTDRYLDARYGPDDPQSLPRLKQALSALASCETQYPANVPQSNSG